MASTPLAPADVPREPSTGVIFATRSYALRAVRFDSPLVVVVLSGAKRLGDQRFEAGQFLVVHRASAADVENLPTATEPYRGWAIIFRWELVDIARALVSKSVRSTDPRRVTRGERSLIEPELRALLAVDASDSARQDHAILGLMLALVRAGHSGFLDAREERLEARVRALVAKEPARPWSSAMLERLLHVSGATLRRKLAAEDTSLREVVVEARLHHAISLLQTRSLPLKTVAAQSGYRSVHAFSRQFEARFGVDPMTVKR